MLLVGGRHGAADLLGGVELVRAERDVVVLAEQQVQDVDVVGLAARPVDQEAGAGALPEGVVDVLRVVGEHAEAAVAADHGVGAAEGLHQHRGDLLLARGGLAVAAAAGDLIDVVDGAEADDVGVHDVADEGLGVLARLALVGIDRLRGQVLVAEGVAGDLAVVVQQAAQHLDQGGLAGARLAVAHEGEDEAAQLDEGVELAGEVVGHQHLRQLHALVLGDVVADHLLRLLEGHDQRRRGGAPRRGEAVDLEVVGLDPVGLGDEGLEVAGAAAAQRGLVHQPLGVAGHDRGQRGVALGEAGELLVELPERALERDVDVVEHDLLGLADLDLRPLGLAPVADQEAEQVGEGEEADQRRARQQLGELRLLRLGQAALAVGLLELVERGQLAVEARDRLGDRQRAPEAAQDVDLGLALQRVLGLEALDPVQERDHARGRAPAGEARRGRAEAAAPGNARGAAAAGGRRLAGAADPRRVVEAREQLVGLRVVLADLGFLDLHQGGGGHALSGPPCCISQARRRISPSGPTTYLRTPRSCGRSRSTSR